MLLSFYFRFVVVVQLYEIKESEEQKVAINNSFIAAAEHFSAKLTKTISKNEGYNFVISPVSEVLALSLLGSSSDTTALKEIKDTIGLTPENNKREEFQFFVDNLHAKANVTLKILTGLFINANIPIKNEFRMLSTNFFKIKLDSVNYSHPYGASAKINSWLEQETDFKIDNLVDFDKINESTSMIVTNAVYFKAKWLNKFCAEKTVENTFSTSDGDKQNVPMMYTDSSFITGPISDLSASFIELPYEDTQFSMIIILPYKVDGLEEVEDCLATMTLTQILSNGNYMPVRLGMPKFQIKTELEMTNALNEMGVNAMFTESDYFSRISDNATHVSLFLQKSYIDVNEQGTVASGIVGFQSASLVNENIYPQMPTFSVDRPFHYKIIKYVNETSTESIVLFAVLLFSNVKLSNITK
ncbi:antichymotrypsin-2-like [Leptopilina heterotoma]|uniref:antichymotrypsin-2-like n=1 Tax=Leptopilina heterotoma TaxID=63436 RepID=UPI001CA8BCB7|nr:antichymotrypsin-2-like [Leptopilina heterotoma]